jgi:hypothetical protein
MSLWSQGIYRIRENRVKQDVHFDDLPAVGEDSGSLSDDFGGEDEVFQDLVVDAGQGSGHGTRLLLTTVAAWFAHDTALANEHDMAVREFLLELTSQSTSQ